LKHVEPVQIHDDLIEIVGKNSHSNPQVLKIRFGAPCGYGRGSTDEGGDKALRAASGLIHMHRTFGIQRTADMWYMGVS